jgi:hypothetical protein
MLGCCPVQTWWYAVPACPLLQFVNYHRETGADITIGCIPYGSDRAKEFGLMKIDNNRRVMVRVMMGVVEAGPGSIDVCCSSTRYLPAGNWVARDTSPVQAGLHASATAPVGFSGNWYVCVALVQSFAEKPKTADALKAMEVDTTVLGE